jgi:hypothetical protein
VKFAIADPPYPGQAAKHYSHDPRCAEVDHAALLARLDADYPAWALCTSSVALREVLAVSPLGTRVGAWVKPFASFKKGVDPAYAWEPVLFKTARKWSRDQHTVRDWVSCEITLRKGLAGAKPPAFCWWLFDLLGCEPGDEIHDLYPGTGAVTQAWASWCRAQVGEMFAGGAA